jgi:hypothetical protein
MVAHLAAACIPQVDTIKKCIKSPHQSTRFKLEFEFKQHLKYIQENLNLNRNLSLNSVRFGINLEKFEFKLKLEFQFR